MISSISSKADINSELESMLGNAWGSMTFTPASTLTASDLANTTRVAAQLPGLRMRTPVKSFNLVSFSPPSLASGCNGIDLTLGSFSMVSKDELISLFRSIASNALSYGFGQAIHAMCPPCWSGMKGIQEEVRKMNEMFRNTCTIAKSLVGDAPGLAVKSLRCNLQTENGIGDWADCAEGDDSVAGQEGEQQKKTDNATVASGADVESVYTGGNFIYRAFTHLGVADDTIDSTLTILIFGHALSTVEVAMNVYGFYNDSPDDTNQQSENYVSPLILDFAEIVNPSIKDGTSNKRYYYVCSNSTDSLSGKSHTCGAPYLSPVAAGFVPLNDMVIEQITDLFERMTADGPFNASSMTHLQKTIANYIEPEMARAIFLGPKKTKQDLKAVSRGLGNIIGQKMILTYLTSFRDLTADIFSKAATEIKGTNTVNVESKKRLVALGEHIKILQTQLNKDVAALSEGSAYREAVREYGKSFSNAVKSRIENR